MSLIPPGGKQAVDTSLAQDDPESPEGIGVTAPQANACEPRSGHITVLPEKLLDTLVAERAQLEEEEMNSVSASQLLMQDLAAQIEQATRVQSQGRRV